MRLGNIKQGRIVVHVNLEFFISATLNCLPQSIVHNRAKYEKKKIPPLWCSFSMSYFPPRDLKFNSFLYSIDVYMFNMFSLFSFYLLGNDYFVLHYDIWKVHEKNKISKSMYFGMPSILVYFVKEGKRWK